MFGECHAHIFMDGTDYKRSVSLHKDGVKDEIIHEHFREYEKRGIAYIRDGGDALGVSKRAMEIASSYGITYRTPIFAIHKSGYYGSIVGREMRNMKEYEGLVGEVRRQGGDFVKIMITGIMNFDRDGSVTGADLSHDEVREMIHIAHEEGFFIMVHANGVDAVRNAVLCGADSIEHGNFINDDCMDAIADSDAIWVPTIVTVRNLLGEGRFSDNALYYIWETQKENLQKAYERGVKLALGSDAGAYGVKHGQGLMDEYQAFQDILGASKRLDQYLKKGEQKMRSKF